MEPMALFKFGGWTKNHQTAKLKSLPNKLCMQYLATYVIFLTYVVLGVGLERIVNVLSGYPDANTSWISQLQKCIQIVSFKRINYLDV